MDFVKNLTGGGNEQQKQQRQQTQKSGGGFTDKLNSLAGGGAQGEKNEDGLDKGNGSLPLMAAGSLRGCCSV